MDEFRRGHLSIPGPESDDIAPYCFTCMYLSYKEFSAGGEGLFFYYCAYSWSEEVTEQVPPCLREPPESE